MVHNSQSSRGPWNPRRRYSLLILVGGITTETNSDLILSSPDDECFHVIILFLVWAQYISSSITQTQNYGALS